MEVGMLYVYAGMVAALTNESATSKSVYFAHCTSEMIFITHLLAEEPEKLAGPLLADTYVTLLKGRNAWYGHKLARGELNLQMGDNIKGKGMIQVTLHLYSFSVSQTNWTQKLKKHHTIYTNCVIKLCYQIFVICLFKIFHYC